MAQDQVLPTEKAKTSLFYGGVKYNEGTVGVTFGVGKHLTGPVILLESADAGQTGAWGNDFLALWHLYKGFYGGFLAGPGVDWGAAGEDDTSPIAYGVAAGGLLASYDFGPLGVSAAWKYKDDLKDSGYLDGSSFGLAVFSWF